MFPVLAFVVILLTVIIMKLNELASKLTVLGDQVAKVDTEIKALKDALANTEIPADAQAALDRLTALVQTADDENADAPPTTPTTTTTEPPPTT